MKDLKHTEIDQFLARFHNFYDGIVKTVQVSLGKPPTVCRVVVTAQDAESEFGWSQVEIELHGLTEFRFELGQTTFEVLSSGIQIVRIMGEFALILDAYPDDDGIPDLSTNTAYAVGHTMLWKSVAIDSK